MNNSSMPTNEKIINDRRRVQNHGEVFTPKRIVNEMLDLPGIREACENLNATFLEPAAGEGTFLVEILNRKLQMVAKNYGDDITRYENYSLLALSTLYGIELLEDNAQKCVMNIFQVYHEAYHQQAMDLDEKVSDEVLDSAKLIISKNIVQGNFLTKLSVSGYPILFNEWKPINFCQDTKTIVVKRTEHTLENIFSGIDKNDTAFPVHPSKLEQLDLFDLINPEKLDQLDLFDYLGNEQEEGTKEKPMEYIPVKITEVYKEEMEEVHG